MSVNVHQTSYGVLREALRGDLLAAVGSGGEDGGLGGTEWRARAALFALLGDHRIDRRGRCRTCRGSRRLRGRRVCRVLVVVRFYLQQPVNVLLAHLAGDGALGVAASASPRDPDATEVLGRVEADPSEPRIQPLPVPAVASPPPEGGPRARRRAPRHGGVGVRPSPGPRPRRAPPPDPPAPLTRDRPSLVGAGSAPWPA